MENEKEIKRYTVQLKNIAFHTKENKAIKQLAGGLVYLVIYLKLLLLQVEAPEQLTIEATRSQLPKELAQRINEQSEDIFMAITYFQNNGLLTIRDPESTARPSGPDRKKEIDKQEAATTKKVSLKELEQRFSELWKLYPNKKGKDKAFTFYQKATREGVTDEEIRQGINAYNAEIAFKRTEKHYIAHGQTWFGNKRWTDVYETGFQQAMPDYSVPEEYQQPERNSRMMPDDLPF